MEKKNTQTRRKISCVHTKEEFGKMNTQNNAVCFASVRFWPNIMLQEQVLQEQLLQEQAPGAWMIWGNILSSICSRSIVWMYTAPGAYLDMLLEHCAF